MKQTFQLIAGTHYQDEDGREVRYNWRDNPMVESDRDLAARWPEKFVRTGPVQPQLHPVARMPGESMPQYQERMKRLQADVSAAIQGGLGVPQRREEALSGISEDLE